MLEKLNLVLPVSAEQVAHIAEGLESDMYGIYIRYQKSLGVLLNNWKHVLSDYYLTFDKVGKCLSSKTFIFYKIN